MNPIEASLQSCAKLEKQISEFGHARGQLSLFSLRSSCLLTSQMVENVLSSELRFASPHIGSDLIMKGCPTRRRPTSRRRGGRCLRVGLDSRQNLPPSLQITQLFEIIFKKSWLYVIKTSNIYRYVAYSRWRTPSCTWWYSPDGFIQLLSAEPEQLNKSDSMNGNRETNWNDFI